MAAEPGDASARLGGVREFWGAQGLGERAGAAGLTLLTRGWGWDSLLCPVWGRKERGGGGSGGVSAAWAECFEIFSL